MVYCPKCGKKFTDNPKTCDNCGEILSEEINLQRISTIFDVVGIGSGIILFILVFFFRKYLNTSITAFLLVLLLIIAVIFLSSSVKRRVQWFIIKLTFGGLKSMQCPECENVVSAENYCLNCGYSLKDVIGYWFLRQQFVELNKHYIRVFKTYRRPRDLTLYRYPPTQYSLKGIKDPEVSWCSHVIFTSPCLKFNYRGHKVNIPINQKILENLKDMLTGLGGPDIVSGPLNWLSNQHKIRFSAVVILLLVFMIGGGYYMSSIFAPAPSVPLTSVTSDVPGLQFSNINGSSSSGYLIVEGNVKNTGTNNIDLWQYWVNITGYDSAGNYVASDDTYVSYSNKNSSGIHDFQPGSMGYFQAYIDDPNKQITSFTVKTYRRYGN